MIVRGTFTLRQNEAVQPLDGLAGGLLEQGPLTAEIFAPDDDDRAGGCLYPSDLADYKPNAEVFLVGSCHPPAGKPVSECGVGFGVGSWSKSLRVVGKRQWGVVGASKPEKFEKMPLGWDRSFGGPGYERNPSGKGFGTPELPNVEAPGSPVSSKTDRPDPAGFGPLNPVWPQRSGKTGMAMHTARPPYFASGVDWTRFNAAPPDQQLKGFLQGDEEISLQNLHSAASVFSTRLPGLYIRAFAKVADGAVSEARMNLDTLLVDTDKGHLVLTWRGHVPCSETDLSDVKTVLIASEKLADEPLSVVHYRTLLEEFHADPIGVMSDAVIPGGRKAMAAAKAAAKDMADHPERPPVESAILLLENDDIMTFGVPDADRAEALKNAASQRDAIKEALAKEKEVVAKQDAMLAEKGITKPPPTPPKTANELAEEAPDVRAQVRDAVKAARTQIEKSQVPPERLKTQIEEIEKLERMFEEPTFKKGMAMSTPPRAAEIGPGKDLSGRNMTDRDFSGLDLSGANFEGSILTGARLVGARLRGANFRQAVLVNADLSGADLSGTNLSEALLNLAKAPGADFRQATLDKVALGKADLMGANFAGARMRQVVLSRANLAEANLNGADLFMVFAETALLERTDFSGAKLVRSTFMRCKLGGAIFKKAILTKSSFMESELAGASFVEAAGEQANFMKADLGGADFRFAVLHAAHFMETKAVGTSFHGADLKGSEFIRACLDRSLFRKANLFGANFDKAQLNETSFLDASLYEAKLATAQGKGTIFVGANTKKAMMPS